MSKKKVSIIIPCYNEENTITLLLDALLHQTFPINQIEVVIADGMSTDHTRNKINEFSRKHPELIVRVVDNNAKTIPAALNTAIKNAVGEYIVRLDAHSIPDKDYVRFSIEGLENKMGMNVGGIWKIHPRNQSIISQSIALAAAHPIGVGDAKYRYTDQAQEVDTVPFGAFRRDLIDKIGLFDESLLSNEDYEFNVRIREFGGKVWLDPRIQAVYFARSTFKELIKQYWRYGYWKSVMIKRYPETIRLRQAMPPLFVLSLIGLLLASFWFPPLSLLLLLEVVSYTLVLILVGVELFFKHKRFWFIPAVPISIAFMHLSWGTAFLWGSLTNLKN